MVRGREISVGVGLLLCATAWVCASDFVSRNGNGFTVCGQPLRFVGFNLRGICHYGHGDILQFSNTADITTNLNYCVAAKVRVIRVFAACHTINSQATGDRLQVILDACQSRGMWAIVCLTDVYTTGLSPQGDDVYYTDTGSLLNHTFYASGYTVNYLPQVQYLANRFKNHKAIFAWQLGNELRDLSSASTFVTFCQNVTAAIRTADPNHMVSSGLIGYHWASLSSSQAQQVYGVLDFVSTHNYNGDDADDDSAIATQLNKPYVVDEAGFALAAGSARVAASNSDITKWINRGVDGYMNWGLMASTYDNGDGDKVFGVDPVFHNADFTLYRDMFTGWGASFTPASTLTPTPASFQHTFSYGTNPNDDAFTLTNNGPSVSYTITNTASWLNVSPAGGTTDCNGIIATIHYTANTLLPGMYSTNVQISIPSVGGSTQTVQVSITIQPTAGDMDGDGDIDQEDFGFFQACYTGTGNAQTSASCTRAHFDADPDVDNTDRTKFLNCKTLSGPGHLIDLDCYK